MKYVIYCHITQCKADKIIKIECEDELHKDEMIRMIKYQDLLSLLIDKIEEVKEKEA